MEGLSQELIAIIVAAIALAAIMVPGMRALRREIAGLDRRLSSEVSSLRAEISRSQDELRAEISRSQEELRVELVGLRADLVEVRNQVSESRERMARVEGLFEGFTRSEPALGTGAP